MKELVELLQVCESLRGSDEMPLRLRDATEKARAAVMDCCARFEQMRNDPQDPIHFLMELKENADPGDADTFPLCMSEDLQAAADEIFYLRQWPAVIHRCDHTIEMLRGTIAAQSDQITRALEALGVDV